MKIREGAYYRTRDGDVVGPMRRVDWCDATFTAGDLTWNEDGSYVKDITYKMDLISEVYVSDTPPDAKRETEAELREMMRDPRYWRTREPEYVKRVTKGFRTLVGGDTPPADTPSFIHPALDGPSGPFLIMPETKTLRDEFAMAAVASCAVGPQTYRDAEFPETAAAAYVFADAMMEARKK
jgi:hypothetical protein